MPPDAAGNVLTVSSNLIGVLAVAGFVVALLAAAVTPILSRLDRLEAWRGPLKLVPYALLLAGALLAGAAARPPVRPARAGRRSHGSSRRAPVGVPGARPARDRAACPRQGRLPGNYT